MQVEGDPARGNRRGGDVAADRQVGNRGEGGAVVQQEVAAGLLERELAIQGDEAKDVQDDVAGDLEQRALVAFKVEADRRAVEPVATEKADPAWLPPASKSSTGAPTVTLLVLLTER
ncbi:MAG: hypothetical protein U1G05_05430 [Kiritimatiellia bacterium]